MSPVFSIITPSFRQPDWLKLCAASIADQQGVTVEHIVQDAGTEGIKACGLQIAENVGAVCQKPEAAETLRAERPGYTLRIVSEKDSGMYDAVNRGLRRASGEILAYLNCDEQYLPGTLAAVGEFFERNPEVDVAFGNVVVVDAEGEYTCSREAMIPSLYHTWICTLCTFTAATFFRQRILEEHGLFFNDTWKNLGDAAWVLELIKRKIRMAVLDRFTSAFADTGKNMNLNSEGLLEQVRLRESAPAWAQKLAPAWVAEFRLRRVLAGMYWPEKISYSIYTRLSPLERKTFVVNKPTSLWISRLRGGGQTGPRRTPAPGLE